MATERPDGFLEDPMAGLPANWDYIRAFARQKQATPDKPNYIRNMLSCIEGFLSYSKEEYEIIQSMVKLVEEKMPYIGDIDEEEYVTLYQKLCELLITKIDDVTIVALIKLMRDANASGWFDTKPFPGHRF